MNEKGWKYLKIHNASITHSATKWERITTVANQDQQRAVSI